MPTHSKPDLAVTALLNNLNEELDRTKSKKVEDLTLTKSQTSVRCRLGPRNNEQDMQIRHCHGGGELCGAIFMCNKRTWKECLGQCLFGLPSGKKPLVEQIVPGMKLFLFEYERRQLWGVFEATSYGGMDIIPDAYSGGSFPCQVRVKVPEECVALYEEEFHAAIRDNYFAVGKFHFELSKKQVCHLSSLFERKYFRTKRMHCDVIKYEDKQQNYNPPGGLPLLLSNDAAYLYTEDFNITSLPPGLYTSRRQVFEDHSFLNSEEGIDFVYNNIENYNKNRCSDTASMVPLSNGAFEIVKNSGFPLNIDITSLSNGGGQLGKGFDTMNASCLACFDTNNRSNVENFVTGDIIPGYSSVTKQGSLETLLLSDNLPRLHSDRPNGKSVWARISRRPKPVVESDTTLMQEKSDANLISPLPLEIVRPIVEIAVVNGSVADANQEAPEKCTVGFKRRRANTNNATEITDETPRRRRKLTRPVFEANASGGSDDMVADQNVCQQSTIDLNLPVELSVEASAQDEQGDAINLHNLTTLKDENNYAMGMCDSLVCMEADAEMQSSMKSKQHIEPCSNTGSVSLDEQMQQEPDVLVLSLASQGATNPVLGSREEIDGNNPPALSVGADAELVAANSSGASTLSLAPCTQEKDLFDSSYPAIKQVDDNKGCAVISCDLAQDILLASGPGNDDDNVNREHASGDLSNAEVGNEAVVHDASSNGNLSKQSETITLDCTSSGSLLNPVGLKSFLSGLQVSGIRLQLGASPCLILQLGDQVGSNSNVSDSNVNSQGQEGKTLEASLSEPSFDERSNQRQPSD